MKASIVTEIIVTVRKLFTECAQSWREFAEGVLRAIQVITEKALCSKGFTSNLRNIFTQK